MSTTASLFALAALLSLGVGAALAALVVARLRHRIGDCDPGRRHRILVVVAALPVLFGLTLLLSATLPALVALVVPAADHCVVHDDHHAHLCFRHGPHGISPAVPATFIALAAIVAIKLVPAALRVRRASRVLRTLLASGEVDRELGITIVESALPICIAAGALRPRIVVARELLGRLHDDDRDIVLAHERAHVVRRDALVCGIVRVLAIFHLPSVGAWIVRELDIAAEQACDEAAAQRVGDRVAVAAMILAMQRAWMTPGATSFGALAPGFGLRALERRVQSLLAEPLATPSFSAHAWCLGAFVAVSLAAASLLHHWTESLLSHVAS